MHLINLKFTGGAAIGIIAGIFLSFMGLLYCYLGLTNGVWWMLIGASFELFFRNNNLHSRN